MNNKILKIEKKLGLKFKNNLLLKQALIHKSKNPESNNERLEFLGDRVIGLVLSKALLDLYPNEKEGVLDKKLSNLVNKKTCAAIAANIHLNKFIILGDLYKKSTDINEYWMMASSPCITNLVQTVCCDQSDIGQICSG